MKRCRFVQAAWLLYYAAAYTGSKSPPMKGKAEGEAATQAA